MRKAILIWILGWCAGCGLDAGGLSAIEQATDAGPLDPCTVRGLPTCETTVGASNTCVDASPPPEFAGDCAAWVAAGNCFLTDGEWCPAPTNGGLSCPSGWIGIFDVCNLSCGRCK